VATVTTEVEDEVHPEAVPTTVYVVVEDGKAETVEPVVPDNPDEGDHTYVFAPFAVNDTELPPGLQMVAKDGLMVTVGIGFTVTITADEQVDSHVSFTEHVTV
jgi:hypothetical protein